MVAVALGRLLLLLLTVGKEREYRHRWIKDINLSAFSVYRFHMRQEYILFSQLIGRWEFVLFFNGRGNDVVPPNFFLSFSFFLINVFHFFLN